MFILRVWVRLLMFSFHTHTLKMVCSFSDEQVSIKWKILSNDWRKMFGKSLINGMIWSNVSSDPDELISMWKNETDSSNKHQWKRFFVFGSYIVLVVHLHLSLKNFLNRSKMLYVFCYLVLRALDTIEDNMNYPPEKNSSLTIGH